MRSYRHTDLREVSLETVLQALADPCRMAILRTLIESGELACGEIPVDVSKATASHHFAVLREAGLVRTRNEGTRCLNSVPTDEVERRFPGLIRLVMSENPEKSRKKSVF